MSSVRRTFAGVVLALLTILYLRSQQAAFTGEAAQYAEQIDRQPIQLLSLIIFLAALLLALIPDREAPAE